MAVGRHRPSLVGYANNWASRHLAGVGAVAEPGRGVGPGGAHGSSHMGVAGGGAEASFRAARADRGGGARRSGVVQSMPCSLDQPATAPRWATAVHTAGCAGPRGVLGAAAPVQTPRRRPALILCATGDQKWRAQGGRAAAREDACSAALCRGGRGAFFYQGRSAIGAGTRALVRRAEGGGATRSS